LPIRMSDRLECIAVSGILRMIGIARTMPDAIGLHVGEPDFPTPDHIRKAAADFILKGRIKYVPSPGIPDLRELIARKLKTENGIAVEASDIQVTAGASQAIFFAVAALVNPGDEVIAIEPCFGNFDGTVRICNGFPVKVPYKMRDGYAVVDEKALAKAVTPRTRAIIINSPNNPTSTILPKEELEKIAKIAIANNIVVISDEPYDHIVYDGVKPISIATLPGMADLTITMNSFSKTYAMTGMRIGYLALKDQKIVQKLAALQENNMICLSPVIQEAAKAALTGPQDCVEEMRREFEKRRDFLLKRLGEIEGIHIQRPRGAFYFFPDISGFGLRSYDFCEELMMKAHVLTVPGTNFGSSGEGHIRISFATDLKTLAEGMDRLERFTKELRK